MCPHKDCLELGEHPLLLALRSGKHGSAWPGRTAAGHGLTSPAFPSLATWATLPARDPTACLPLSAAGQDICVTGVK